MDLNSAPALLRLLTERHTQVTDAGEYPDAYVVSETDAVDCLARTARWPNLLSKAPNVFNGVPVVITPHMQPGAVLAVILGGKYGQSPAPQSAV